MCDNDYDHPNYCKYLFRHSVSYNETQDGRNRPYDYEKCNMPEILPITAIDEMHATSAKKHPRKGCSNKYEVFR